MLSPAAEYRHRLDRYTQLVMRYQQRDFKISVARAVFFFLGIFLLILGSTQPDISLWWTALPFIAFITLVVIHSRILQFLSQYQNATHFYSKGLDRLNHRWKGVGASGERYQSDDHAYSGDLDLFGHGSLFQLISSAQTRLGEDQLARWLQSPADVSTIHSRQQSIEELRSFVDLREKFALLSSEVNSELDQNQLTFWAQQEPKPVSRIAQLIAFLLSISAIVCLVCFFIGLIKLWMLMVVILLETILFFCYRKKIRQLAHSVNQAGSGLLILSQVLQLIEKEPFQTSYLQKIIQQLSADNRLPSQWIKHLHRLILHLNNCMQNQFFAPIAFLTCLPIHLIQAVEHWRTKVRHKIPIWLESVGEFEALLALSRFAYEHPSFPFPEIDNQTIHFEGKKIGHPLILGQQCVLNDVTLNESIRLILISGSNMSGKSTLMRTIGVNTVLALSGAPVFAEKLKLSPMMVGTAMRVRDSLQDGKSLFYASISRLKSVINLSQASLPLLFLFDEILQGTNSHDRRVGTEGIIKKLVLESRALGCVATHDLALTEIAQQLDPLAINVHFEDQLIDGKIHFNYQLRPGVVQRSNALELMRMMGLEI